MIGGETSERDAEDAPGEALTRRRRWVPLRGMDGSRATFSNVPLRGMDGSRATFSNVPLREHRSRTAAPSGDDSEWVIVGGGVHGVYLARFLTSVGGVAPGRLHIVDPNAQLLGRWKQNTENVGMTRLRSPVVHHLDIPSLSLRRFDRASLGESPEPAFLAPYNRPLLALFNAHANAVIRGCGLERAHIRGSVDGLERDGGGYLLHLRGAADGSPSTVRAQRVLLAVGNNEETAWPAWASHLRSEGARIAHVLDPDFRAAELAPWRNAVVYGGGLSGTQLALALASRQPGSVVYLSGHAIETHLFDSEPSWQGASFMQGFASQREPSARREIIRRARHKGSMTPEARMDLERACAADRVRFRQIERESIRTRFERATGEMIIRTNVGRVRCDLLILATGYRSDRPGGAWLDDAIVRYALPCAADGFPIVPPSLEWMPGLFVSGALAELETGPVSRNIAGAHRTAARLEYFQLGVSSDQPSREAAPDERDS